MEYHVFYVHVHHTYISRVAKCIKCMSLLVAYLLSYTISWCCSQNSLYIFKIQRFKKDSENVLIPRIVAIALSLNCVSYFKIYANSINIAGVSVVIAALIVHNMMFLLGFLLYRALEFVGYDFSDTDTFHLI